jgi:hypothetical protein
MSEVYANGREVSAKKDDNKSICAMPDVCLSPPSPPAGPVPIPYPNTAAASDTSEGSKTVKIGGQEVGLKNKSTYKKSNGDEAATKSLGMGIVSHNIQGPMKHTAWSMDVKIEGENVIRHMDLTIHNHSNPPQPAVVLDQAKQKIAADEPLNCEELDALNEEMRKKDLKKPEPGRGFTATTASATPAGGGPSRFSKSVTRQDLIKSGRSSGFAGTRKGSSTDPCKVESWGSRGKNHTEAKLIGEMFDQGGGSITMSINWKPAGERRFKRGPCKSCKKGICKAVQCKLEIKLCKNGKAETPPCKNGRWVGGN